METRIGAGATYVFPAGALDEQVRLENRHNVAGQVTYQIAAQPAVNIQIQPNQENTINQIRAQSLTIINGLPNSLYAVY
ncbi:MAG: hypothetical protein HYU62_07265 [Caulobacterales bacterium]|nr:hypothetical protein [Caulobacterales bacterium]